AESSPPTPIPSWAPPPSPTPAPPTSSTNPTAKPSSPAPPTAPSPSSVLPAANSTPPSISTASSSTPSPPPTTPSATSTFHPTARRCTSTCLLANAFGSAAGAPSEASNFRRALASAPADTEPYATAILSSLSTDGLTANLTLDTQNLGTMNVVSWSINWGDT